MLLLRPYGIAVLVGALLLPALAVAQGSDPHLGADAARPLYCRSAFVHGYIHGYEDGFHTGDLDIHMGHAAQPMTQYKLYRDTRGYQSRFGDHGSFRRGYQQGFRAGYEDAMDGQAFRAVSEIRRAAEGIAGVAAADREFDQALAAGYAAGQGQGLEQPRMPADFQYAAERCLAARHNPAYCDAFSRGFSLGYADGFALQRSRQMQMAERYSRPSVRGGSP